MAAVGDKVECKKLAEEGRRCPTVPGTDGAVDDEKRGAEDRRARSATPSSSRPRPAAAAAGCASPTTTSRSRPACGRRRPRRRTRSRTRRVYIEKYVEFGRHVEVQILADHHGNAVHLWERDCSLQRRHQKLVEESPAPAAASTTSAKRCATAAVRLVKAAGYTNAGTVEFLVDKDQNFYFIEVNARIQVEHPVTELVTGIDLIKEQIRIAAGEPLPLQAGGHHADRPRDRVPHQRRRPGAQLRPVARPDRASCASPAARACGSTRTPTPATASRRTTTRMIGKLIVHRPTRAEAIAAMKRALREFHIAPIKTTIPLHLQIMDNPHFLSGDVDTGFIERVMLSK